MSKRGRLICIDGMDAAGKTTQAGRLCNWLTEHSGGISVPLVLSFPVYSTPIGDIIHRGLHGRLHKNYTKEIQCLLMTANRYEMLPTIQHALDSGRHVILNRYTPSNLAYGTASEVDPLWIEQLDSHLPQPDRTIVLLTKPSTIDKRRNKDKQDVFETDKKYIKTL